MWSEKQYSTFIFSKCPFALFCLATVWEFLRKKGAENYILEVGLSQAEHNLSVVHGAEPISVYLIPQSEFKKSLIFALRKSW